VSLSTAEMHALAEVAMLAATTAGHMVASSRPGEVAHKAAGASLASQVVTDIDRRSEAIIVEQLGPSIERHGLALLTEERDDDGGRHTAEYFWCVDPLDGTLPFIEGRPGYSVSIALVGRDGTPHIGVIHDPVEDRLLHAVLGGGAFVDGEPWQLPAPGPAGTLSVFADRSFGSMDHYEVVIEALGRVAREMGLDGLRMHSPLGGVMNACGVLASPPACYVKYPAPVGGGSLWDFAATACLFGELGAVATDIGGGPLDLNRSDATTMNHRGVVFATDEDLAQRIRAIRPDAAG
jgi:fructose-1,6-bisphosphatase/inositol monophosphatase family enzyme